MTESAILAPLTVIAVTGCGLMAGLFFVFSVSVMKALGQMRPHEGMKAMQLINRTILNSVFLATFFGTAISCLSIAVICVLPASLQFRMVVADDWEQDFFGAVTRRA